MSAQSSSRAFAVLPAVLVALLLAVVSGCAQPAGPGLAGGEIAAMEVGNIEPASGLRDGKYRASWLDDTRGELLDEWGQPVATASIHLLDPYDNQDGLQLADFYGGCNTITATLSDTGISNLMQTVLGCPDDVFESTLVESLNRGDFQVIDDSHFSVGDLLFTFWLAPGENDPNAVLRDGVYSGGLETWDDDCVDGEACAVMFTPNVSRATVTERGTQFVFDAGCNVLRTGLANGSFTPIASTRMACPPDSHEDELLAQLASGKFEVRSDSLFRLGDFQFSWSGSEGDELPPLFTAEPPVPETLLDWSPVPESEAAAILEPPQDADFGTPLYAIGEVSGERVIYLNLFGSTSCPPIIVSASATETSLMVTLDGEAYGPTQVCTADLGRHAFVLTPAADSGFQEIPDQFATAWLDKGITHLPDGGMATSPTWPILLGVPAQSAE